MTESVALFAATLLHSATNTHFFHWETNSFSEHKALGKYYEEIVDLVDSYVETYMGCYEQIKSFPNVYHQPKDALKYLESLKKFVDEATNDSVPFSEEKELVLLKSGGTSIISN